LKAPAGLDLGAITAQEIAASILAELVQVRRRGPIVGDTLHMENVQAESEKETAELSATAVDPVCGMIVETATTRHRSNLDDQVFYFCCPACKRLFERNPQEYLVHER
jgi:xanthine dehydrogenase accessory factor